MLFFYNKCTALVLAPVIFVFFTGYSATPLYGMVCFILFNLTLTSLINLLFGMFEIHLFCSTLLAKPELYRSVSWQILIRLFQIANQANLKLGYIIAWILDGMWLGLVAFFVVYFALAGNEFHSCATFYQISDKFPYNEVGFFDFSLCGCSVFVYIWIALMFRSMIWTRNFNLPIVLSFLITLGNVGILFAYQVSSRFKFATC